MEFTCHTTYQQKALTAMARALRKTVRAKRSRRAHIYSWFVIGITLVALYLSWGTIWQTIADGVVIAGLLLVIWKEDALNGFFAKRRMLPGTDAADLIFREDDYLVKSAAAESKWQYDKILALAETKEYLLFVMGKHHALAIEKAALEGGSVLEFCHFLEERTGKKIQAIGG